jgi:hypothetical protein
MDNASLYQPEKYLAGYGRDPAGIDNSYYRPRYFPVPWKIIIF